MAYQPPRFARGRQGQHSGFPAKGGRLEHLVKTYGRRRRIWFDFGGGWRIALEIDGDGRVHMPHALTVGSLPAVASVEEIAPWT